MKTVFKTQGGVTVTRTQTDVPVEHAFDHINANIDQAKGVILASDYEYPGRYSRWDIGFIDPPVEILSFARQFNLNALNKRGVVLLKLLAPALHDHPHIEQLTITETQITGRVMPMPASFPEEQRSKQPSVFSVLRAVTQYLACDDEYLSIFGAFGYDLVFQFEPIKLKHDRDKNIPDCHLFLADRVTAVDHQKQSAFTLNYEFSIDGLTTDGIPVEGARFAPPKPLPPAQIRSDHQPGEYAKKVEQVRQGCKRGDYFEVVLSQVFSAPCADRPSDIFDRLRKRNPSPYDFLINLGGEQLIGASPEMFVRVDGDLVETCPISGTVQRGASPMEDAQQIFVLLASEKDKSELTMCTDVDRNDKSRVCVPGSVQLVSRRLIETYSRLFHTVDHVKGTLLPDCDIFDAFLSHLWACTLTGSPKPIAMQTIENLENSPRGWYGGCVGLFTMNKQLNTGITIRTIHLKNGTAGVRAGATLLYHSDPDEEEQETRVKASAFLNALTHKPADAEKTAAPSFATPKSKTKRILFVDNQDSFVHTLANYVRQTGAEVITLRNNFPYEQIDKIKPDLVFISPGPCTPREMGVLDLVDQAVKRSLPIFGVCLGHQGIAEYFGAKLGVLGSPVHGRESRIMHTEKSVFKGLPNGFSAGRYHSLYVLDDSVPTCLAVTARSHDDVIMGLQHKTLPIASVQFHPESILTLHDDIGRKIIANMLDQLT